MHLRTFDTGMKVYLYLSSSSYEAKACLTGIVSDGDENYESIPGEIPPDEKSNPSSRLPSVSNPTTVDQPAGKLDVEHKDLPASGCPVHRNISDLYTKVQKQRKSVNVGDQHPEEPTTNPNSVVRNISELYAKVQKPRKSKEVTECLTGELEEQCMKMSSIENMDNRISSNDQNRLVVSTNGGVYDMVDINTMSTVDCSPYDNVQVSASSQIDQNNDYEEVNSKL